MIKLRPYQQKFVDEIRTKLFQKEKIIACAATGSGKTKIFLSITKMSIEKGKTVLIISESSKIFKQIADEIGNATEIVSAVKHLDIKPNSIFVAMAQTLVRRPAIVKQLSELGKNLIVIVDEAHIGTPTKLLLAINESYRIGFTATPDFRYAKHLPILYNDICVGAQPQELVDIGFLSPYYHFERRVVNLSELKKGSDGDFTEKSQEQAFEKAEVYDGVFSDITKFPFKKCMVFCSSIKHAEETAHQFRSYGYKVAVVHSKNEESNYELFQFKDLTSGVDICISVGVLTKGFDYPAVDLLVLLRATTSLPLFLQMCGRGSRINDFTNKKRFTVICYGGNGTRHNLWNYTHDWAELWNKKPKKKGDGVASIKNCPKCDMMVPVRTTICPNCGYEWISEPKVKDVKETELVELNTRIKAFRGRSMSDLLATELADYARVTNRKPYCIRIARSKNDIKFLTDFAHRMNYKEQWATINFTDEKIEYHNTTIK
jgi:superfamily II DNA or RNA helicase